MRQKEKSFTAIRHIEPPLPAPDFCAAAPLFLSTNNLTGIFS
jgi:hypothetical protein